MKNRKIFLIYTFVDALAQMFASWRSIILKRDSPSCTGSFNFKCEDTTASSPALQRKKKKKKKKKTYELCYKAEYVKTLSILGQNSQILCTNREKLGIIFSIYIFVDALAQMFATWYLATSQNILVMPQSWIYPSLSIFGQNSQILSKCHEKLENILVPKFC